MYLIKLITQHPIVENFSNFNRLKEISFKNISNTKNYLRYLVNNFGLVFLAHSVYVIQSSIIIILWDL